MIILNDKSHVFEASFDEALFFRFLLKKIHFVCQSNRNKKELLKEHKNSSISHLKNEGESYSNRLLCFNFADFLHRDFCSSSR